MKRDLFFGLLLSTSAVSASATSVTNASGVVTWTVDSGETLTIVEALTDTVSGAVKEGAGTVVLSAAASGFAGPIAVNAGTLQADVKNAFGTGTVTVADGAGVDLHITSNPGQGDTLFSETKFVVTGNGPGGRGAVYYSGNGYGDRAIQFLTLSGDARVGGSARWGVQTTLDLGGHTLDINVPSPYWMFNRTAIRNPGHLKVKRATIQGAASFSGGSANTLSLDMNGGALNYWGANANPVANWTLRVVSNSYVRAGGSYGTSDRTYNRWGGPVVIDAEQTLTVGSYDSTNNIVQFAGAISGAGRLVKQTDNCLFLDGTCTYTGGTEIQAGRVFVGAPERLAQYNVPGKLSVKGTSALLFYTPANQVRWSSADLAACVNNAAEWTKTAYVGFNSLGHADLSDALTRPVSFLKTASGSATVSSPLNGFANILCEAGSLTVKSPGVITNALLRVNGGRLALDGGVYVDVQSSTPQIGASNGSAPATFVISNATLVCTVPASNGTPTLYINDTGTKGALMKICDGAVITNKIQAGTMANSKGAVYQYGGFVRNVARSGNDGWFGHEGYGFYSMEGGTNHVNSWLGFGHGTGAGVIQMTGGLWKQDAQMPISRGGYGRLYLSGGTLAGGSSLILGEQHWGRGVDIGDSVVTIDGPDACAKFADVQICERTNNFTAVLNLNRGVLETDVVFEPIFTTGPARSATARSLLNFNGGAFRASASRVDFLGGGNYRLDRVTLFEKGGTIDTPDGRVLTDTCVGIGGPTGKGVKKISYTLADRSGYLGAPEVYVSGGGGEGATAHVMFDSKTGMIGDVVVTSPGNDYTSAPEVKFYNAARTAFVVCQVELTDGDEQVCGPLYKTGSGDLKLYTAWTYTGDTVISNGQFHVVAAGALPVGNTVRLASLDQSGMFTLWTNQVTLAGFGGMGRLRGETNASLTVTDRLVFDAQDILAGGSLRTDSFLFLRPETTVEIANANLLTETFNAAVLATATKADTFPRTLPVNLPSPWKVVSADSGKVLKLVNVKGTMFVLR